MGIIVPVLRLGFVFLNVYETFKTMKLPPRSSRNGGQPSVRAMSQRKRALKGCMAVWLIWSCYVVYEKTLDPIVGIFIPFYSEIKALVLLFFMLTRARGAEPIYLHIFRPLVKPYTPLLDAMVEVVNSIGDVIMLICAVPIHFVSSILSRWTGAHIEELPDEVPSPPSRPDDRPEVPPTETIYGATRTRRGIQQNARDKSNTSKSAKRPTVGSRLPSERASHDIWYPSTAAYEDDDSPPNGPKGLPTPPSEDQLHMTRDAVDDGWRRYEAFPSAYPATPATRSTGLPPVLPEGFASLEGISEEVHDGLPRTTYNGFEHHEQGFQGSLKSQRESNPDSDVELSDGHKFAAGVFSSDDEMSVDGGEDEEEDDFNVTLATPYPLSRVQNFSSATTASMDRMTNISSALSTTDNGSPLRTRTNSEASTTLYTSDSSSVAGRKRALPPSADENAPARPVLERHSTAQGTIRGRAIPTRASSRPPLPIQRSSTQSSASGAENKDIPDDTSFGSKKRRVGTTSDARSQPIHRVTLRTNVEPPIRKPTPSATASRRAPAVPMAGRLRPTAFAKKNSESASSDSSTRRQGATSQGL